MNGFAKQILRFWNELGLNQKVSLSLAAAMVVAGMAALLFWSSTPQMVLLYGGMDSKDMGEVVKALDEQAISYEIRPGNSVFIAQENVYKVRMDLASQGIPNGGSIGYEIFDRTNFGVSDFVQRTNYIRAMQGELQRTITQLRGVRSARVMIVMPQNRLMVNNEPARATASVMVDTGGKTLEEDAVNSIRFLVANSVEALASKDVVVVDANGKALSQDLVQDPAVGAASGQFKFRKRLEDYYTRKVETMLARIVGPQNVVARVSVELNTEAVTITNDIYDPNGQVVRSQTQTDEINRSSELRGSGNDAVGAQANAPTPPAGAGSSVAQTPTNNSEESRKNKSVNYEISHSRTETVRAPGSVSRVSAAVFIARRYEGEGAQRTEQPRSAEEIEQIRQMIVQAIGAEEPQGAAAPTVTVAERDFVPQVDPMEENKPDMVETIFTWVEMLRNFIVVGVAAIIFLVFLRILKKHKPEPYSLEVMEEEMANSKKGAEAAPRLTPELLNELIREKPENVSTALRNWALESGNKK